MYHGSKQHNSHWESLSFQEVKELRWTATKHGIESPYFGSLLNSMLSAHLMTPTTLDLLQVSDTDLYTVYFVGGRVEKGSVGTSFDLCGTQKLRFSCFNTGSPCWGEAVHGPDQAHESPKEALEGIREAARKAFLKVPGARIPQKIFTNIIQEAREQFMQFIDRLKWALEWQIDNKPAQEILLLKLTVENANRDCKKLLKSLTNPNPTLVEIIEACNCLGTLECTSETTWSWYDCHFSG